MSESIGPTRVEPFFTLVGGPRKHEQCLFYEFCWPSEHLASLLCYENYLIKTNKFWNINFMCLQVGGFLSAGDLVRDPQPKKCVLMRLNKLQHSLVVGKNKILWLFK